MIPSVVAPAISQTLNNSTGRVDTTIFSSRRSTVAPPSRRKCVPAVCRGVSWEFPSLSEHCSPLGSFVAHFFFLPGTLVKSCSFRYINIVSPCFMSLQASNGYVRLFSELRAEIATQQRQQKLPWNDIVSVFGSYSSTRQIRPSRNHLSSSTAYFPQASVRA